MTGDDTHNAFVAGYELGLALRCDQDTTQADHEARHARVRPMVLAMVADLHRRGSGDHEAIQERRQQHQIDALQRNQAAARPWPPEDPNPSARVLNGWPDLPKRVNT
jgi:hypothetical protein